MENFQLYKKRDFNTLISDTLQFFKLFWKNYLVNYIVLLGGLILVIAVIEFFLMKSGGISSLSGLESFRNWGTGLALTGLILLIFLVFGIFTMAFPMVYLRLVNQSEKSTYSVSEVFEGMKQRAGRIFVYGLFGTFTLGILTVIVAAICSVLSMIIIGIPLMILAFSTMLVWSMQAMYVFVEEDIEFFDALRFGWQNTFRNYWGVVGSSIIIGLCVMVIYSAFTFIPMIATMGSILSSGHNMPMETPTVVIVLGVIGLILTYFLYNVLYIHQGLVYYSAVEDEEHVQALSDIDTIGSNNEE